MSSRDAMMAIAVVGLLSGVGAVAAGMAAASAAGGAAAAGAAATAGAGAAGTAAATASAGTFLGISTGAWTSMATAASAAGTAQAGYIQQQQADFQQAQMDLQIVGEQTQAEFEEAQRMRDLNSSLSSQRAIAGITGGDVNVNQMQSMMQDVSNQNSAARTLSNVNQAQLGLQRREYGMAGSINSTRSYLNSATMLTEVKGNS